MNDKDFDRHLSESIIPPPDDKIADDISPWKKSFYRIVAGLVLTTSTIDIYIINIVLPLIGCVLLVLGFRSVRKENRYFTACYVLSLINIFADTALTFADATIYRSYIDEAVNQNFLLKLLASIPTLLILIFFCAAVRTVKSKSKLYYKYKGADIGLIIWYCVLILISCITTQVSIITGAVLMLSYILILVFLVRMLIDMELSGYTVTPSSIKISDSKIIAVYSAIVIVGMLIGTVFFTQHRMDWKPHTETQDSQVISVKADLVKLGIPEYILNDLTDEDILACSGATDAVFEQTDRPMNSGRKVTEVKKIYSTQYITHTVYDVKELRMTNIAVKIPGENTTWRIIRHFHWVVKPKFFITEAISAFDETPNIFGFMRSSDISGRLLYNKNDTTYTAGFPVIADYKKEDAINNVNFTAGFSFPNSGDNQRGYIAYTISNVNDKYEDVMISEWLNYVHQRAVFMHPFKSAYEHEKNYNMFSSNWNFRRTQDALQFDNGEY
ncbi:MAG: hypothetical protein IJO24_06815 [Clostridia bacterium]|nr:hypothetical protein [Clostridia bacterium]